MAMAYHPVFAPYGTRKFNDNKFWYETTNTVASIADCFTKASTDGSVSGRPDNKIGNRIYNELWIDQRWRAEYYTASKELTTIERDKDISATQYADFVGSATWETKAYLSGLSGGVLQEGRNTSFSSRLLNTPEDAYYPALVYDGTKWIKGNYVEASNPVSWFVQAWDNGVISVQNDLFFVDDVALAEAITSLIVLQKSKLRYGSNTYLHTDIIGNPANYPDTWKSALAGGGSIAGTPLLVGENGESLLPDGTSKTFKMSKKVFSTAVYAYSGDGGTSWSSDSVTPSSVTNSVTNSDALNSINLWSYKAYNNNLTPVANSRVLGGSAGVSDVWAACDMYTGGGLSSKAINKIPTTPWTSVDNTLEVEKKINSVHLEKNPEFSIFGKLDTNNYAKPTHDTISLYGSTSPAVKTFSYLTQNTATNVAQQVYVFKEMKYNTDWGDDSKFNITDNVSTTPNDNGQTILYGQKARLIDGVCKE